LSPYLVLFPWLNVRDNIEFGLKLKGFNATKRKQSMQHLLFNIWKKEKTTILFITHDIDEAIFLSQRIYVMQARPGRIIEEIDADLNLFNDGELVEVDKFVKLKKHIVSLLKH
jgi:NitT/TauT family transport system ATP-binding protein